MLAFKAEPGRFEQLIKNITMEPLSQTRIFLMYQIHNASFIWTWVSNWKYVYQQANSVVAQSGIETETLLRSPNRAIPTDASNWI